MKTRADLIAAALKLLNALAAGQAPEAEDYDEIDGLIDGKIAELNRQDVVYFSDTTQFEDEFIDPIATLLADMAAPSFGQPRNPASRDDAIARIRAMRPSSRVSEDVTPSQYF